MRKATPKKTQLERAAAIVGDVATHVEAIRFCEVDLDTVLGEAQNSPPDGAADGSITNEQWDALKLIQKGLRAFCDGYDSGMRKGRGGPFS